MNEESTNDSTLDSADIESDSSSIIESSSSLFRVPVYAALGSINTSKDILERSWLYLAFSGESRIPEAGCYPFIARLTFSKSMNG